MDPITVGCVGLAYTISMLLLKITAFVSEVRSSRKDMDAVVRELMSLQLSLGALKDNELVSGVNYPEQIRDCIKQVIVNCEITTQQMTELLLKLQSGKLGRRIQWVTTEEDEMNNLRSSLETNKTTLEIILTTGNLAMLAQQSRTLAKQSMQSESISTAVSEINTKVDALSIIQKDTAEIKNIGLEVAELRNLFAQLAKKPSSEGVQSVVSQLRDYAASLIEPVIIASEKLIDHAAVIEELALDFTLDPEVDHRKTRNTQLSTRVSAIACDLCQDGWIEHQNEWVEYPVCSGLRTSSAADKSAFETQDYMSHAQARAEIVRLEQEVLVLQTELQHRSRESSAREQALNDRQKALDTREEAMQKTKESLKRHDTHTSPSSKLARLPTPNATPLHTRLLCTFHVYANTLPETSLGADSYTLEGPTFTGYAEHDGYPISGYNGKIVALGDPSVHSVKSQTPFSGGPTTGAQLLEEMLRCLHWRLNFAKIDASPEALRCDYNHDYARYNRFPRPIPMRWTRLWDDRSVCSQLRGRGPYEVRLFMIPFSQHPNDESFDVVTGFGKAAKLWRVTEDGSLGKADMLCKECTLESISEDDKSEDDKPSLARRPKEAPYPQPKEMPHYPQPEDMPRRSLPWSRKKIFGK